jgi:hypothetical protein
VAEHEEPDGLHAELACRAEVLDRDVRLGAVGRDPGDARAGVVRGLEVVDGRQAGEGEDAILARVASSTAARISLSSSTFEKP